MKELPFVNGCSRLREKSCINGGARDTDLTLDEVLSIEGRWLVAERGRDRVRDKRRKRGEERFLESKIDYGRVTRAAIEGVSSHVAHF